MDELSKILAVSKAQAAAGTERIAFDPMALVHAIEAGVAARVAAEREHAAKLVDHILREGGGTWGDEIRKGLNVAIEPAPRAGSNGAR